MYVQFFKTKQFLDSEICDSEVHWIEKKNYQTKHFFMCKRFLSPRSEICVWFVKIPWNVQGAQFSP